MHFLVYLGYYDMFMKRYSDVGIINIKFKLIIYERSCIMRLMQLVDNDHCDHIEWIVIGHDLET